MPETSIVIKSEDRYSDSVKKMAQVSKSFSKDAEEMQGTLDRLNKNKYSLKLDADKAMRELKAMEKQFAATGDEADGLRAELAQANYDNIRRNLSLVTKEARQVEKQMESTAGTFRKTENAMSGGGGGLNGVVGALAASGIGQMASQVAQQAANTLVSSAFGSTAGGVFSSALSSAVSGAAIGSMINPGLGTAIGAAAGAGIGAITGGVQAFQAKDDAYKSYVQELYGTVMDERAASLTGGSSTAAQRETDQISFSTLFGSETVARDYLGQLVDFSNVTPFLYSDLTAMSKTLATYGYGADGILPVLQTVGDTGAALGMNTSDMNMVSTALGRMKSSNKTTLEYLSILNDRGVGAVGMLAEAKGVDVGTMYDMVSKGKVAGEEAVDIILQALTDSFAGAMERQSKTFSGLSSTVEGLQQNLDAAMGEGFNTIRSKGLQEQIDWMNSDSGQGMQEAYRALGQWQAGLENKKEEYARNAIDDAMKTTAYQEAKIAGDGEAMGRIIAEAKVHAIAEYDANEGKDQELASQLALVEAIQEDPTLKAAYETAGYALSQEMSKGMGKGLADALPGLVASLGNGNGTMWTSENGTVYDFSGYAYGLDRVPYDDFPAMLHQGERVLTAAQARQADRGGSGVAVQITGPVTIREEADLERLAELIFTKVQRAALLAAP